MYPICYATTIFLSKFPMLAKEKVWWCCWEKGWDLVCVCEMKPQAWEELQHSLKANKSLELLCSSRPKKGRVVVGSLKILLLLLFSAPRSRLFSSPVLRPSFYNVGREENFCAFKLSPWRQMTEIFSSATGDYSQVKSYVVLPCDMFNTAYYLQAAPSTISQLFLLHSVWKSIKKGLIWQTLFLPFILLLFWFAKVHPIQQLTLIKP